MRKNKKGQIIYNSLFKTEKIDKSKNFLGYLVINVRTNAPLMDSQGMAARLFKSRAIAKKHMEFLMAFFAEDYYLMPTYGSKKIKYPSKD